jgi:predicted transcriptional regulator
MKNIDIKEIEANYEILFCGKVQDCVIKRKNLGVTQFQMSYKIGVSLSTIQNFEKYQCKNGFLIFAYNKILD